MVPLTVAAVIGLIFVSGLVGGIIWFFLMIASGMGSE